jgi:hypothetical protein
VAGTPGASGRNLDVDHVQRVVQARVEFSGIDQLREGPGRRCDNLHRAIVVFQPDKQLLLLIARQGVNVLENECRAFATGGSAIRRQWSANDNRPENAL